MMVKCICEKRDLIKRLKYDIYDFDEEVVTYDDVCKTVLTNLHINMCEISDQWYKDAVSELCDICNVDIHDRIRSWAKYNTRTFKKYH